ncbi:MAG: hypothetical protein HYR56_06360 [Acidobacteria bacterium]|nr:hypothetical protein [Acidobacteriota bacterium]MBI3422242.1 hypothetical protein [Acidobacteriota bacterium]
MTKTAGLLALILVGWLAACGNNKMFDSAAWLQGNLRARGRMCEDLVQRKLLLGQPVAEAHRLLGPPNKDYGSVLSYNIDLGWPFKDPIHYGLQVRLDQDRKVREVKIVD